MITEVRGYGPVPPLIRGAGVPPDLLLPIHLRSGQVDIRLLSILATIVAPTDVTVQELRIETFFPADAESVEVLREVGAAELT